MTELKTQRLVLKPATDEDKHAIAERLDDLDVARWLSNVPHPYTLSDAEEWIGIVAESARGEVPGFKLSIFMDDTLIGGVGLNHREGNVYELGYWLGKAFWGRGIATEAATGLLQHAEQALPDAQFVAHCMKGNLASSRVLEKLGFQIMGEVEIDSRSLGVPVPCLELELK
jgi:RimJ/RimL family protein N-acetyltransferase